MKIRCAVINGDLTTKFRECKAQSEEPIPENVARFLEELQRVAAEYPQLLNTPHELRKTHTYFVLRFRPGPQ